MPGIGDARPPLLGSRSGRRRRLRKYPLGGRFHLVIFRVAALGLHSKCFRRRFSMMWNGRLAPFGPAFQQSSSPRGVEGPALEPRVVRQGHRSDTYIWNFVGTCNWSKFIPFFKRRFLDFNIGLAVCCIRSFNCCYSNLFPRRINGMVKGKISSKIWRSN